MAEYINKEDVLRKVMSSLSVPSDNQWDCGYNTAMVEIREFIRQLSVIDVQIGCRCGARMDLKEGAENE